MRHRGEERHSRAGGNPEMKLASRLHGDDARVSLAESVPKNTPQG